MFTPKHFNLIQNFNKAELNYLIDFAIHLKHLKKKRIPHEYLKGQNIALIFDKTSSRTRAAFVVASTDLGAHPETLVKADIQFGTKESVEDSAKVFGSTFDAIMLRVSDQTTIDIFEQNANVPIWNGMTNDWHPTQMIADFMTIKEHYGTLSNQHLVFVGDGRSNVANSLLVTAAILGVDVTIISPKDLQPSKAIYNEAQEYAKKSNAQVIITDERVESIKTATVVYTDVWISIGEEEKTKERIHQLKGYTVDKDFVQPIKNEFIFMHCLPAFHNTKTEIGQKIKEKYNLDQIEVNDNIFNSKEAKQFNQAENRMHSIKAIMAMTNGNLFIPDIK